MNYELVRQFSDACMDGKKIFELLPKLPPKMKPRHIRIIRCIHVIQEEKGIVRISDVAIAMKGTMPSITKLVNELCEMGAVVKTRNPKDKRVYTLQLTSWGEKCYDKYIRQFHTWLMKEMDDIPEEDIQGAVRAIGKVREILEKRKKK